MRVSRNLSLAVQYVLDEWVPPRIRDSRWFMRLPMRVVLRDAADDFRTFKDSVFAMNDTEFSALYQRTAHVQQLQGLTDLNSACIEAILSAVRDREVLEVGCGRGFLAARMAAASCTVTACDIDVAEDVRERYPDVRFEQANIESLPYADASFDTVVCTHTLEHVQHLHTAVAELRRVARRQLIIVVPRQRPYRYTFSLHTQFFPYEWSLHAAFGIHEGVHIRRLGDWYYAEQLPDGARADAS